MFNTPLSHQASLNFHGTLRFFIPYRIANLGDRGTLDLNPSSMDLGV